MNVGRIEFYIIQFRQYTTYIGFSYNNKPNLFLE